MSGFFLKNGCCYGSLSIAEPTITGTDLTMLKDFEAFLLEAGAEQTSQPAIVHASAGECDLGDCGGFLSADCCCYETLCDTSMEVSSDLRSGNACAKIIDQRAPEMGDSEHA